MNVLPLPGPSLVLHTKDRAVALAVDGYENRTASDKTPSHYEEDHFISLELGATPAIADAPGGAADHRDGLVRVLSEPRVEGGMVPRRADWGVDVVASRNFVTPPRVS